MNIIYFNPDELRADALGCYGHPLAQTPNFDRLAAEGVRFEQCHVQHTVCTPSRCSFMTGWYPHTRGHRTLWYPLQQHEPNTLRYLKQAGYNVQWFGKNDLLAADSYADSVVRVHEPAPRHMARAENCFPVGTPGYYSFLYEPLTSPPGDWDHVENAVRFLQQHKPGDQPFMLNIAIGFPHCPYTAPQPWYDMYNPADLPALRPAELEGKPDFFTLIREYRQLNQMDESILSKIMAVYLGMTSYVDHLLGRLLNTLDATGLAETTTVIAFSDHGDWAGDYGLVEKWPSALDDCLTRIPMIIRAPDCLPGRVVDEPVECFDIMPTTLELAGVPAQHSHHAHSLLPQLHGCSGDPERAVFAEGGYGPAEPHCLEGGIDGIRKDKTGIYYPKGLQQQEHPESVCRATMLRTSMYKLIWRAAGQSELYDLQEDPCELRNVFSEPEYVGERQRLCEQMMDWFVTTSDVVPWERQARGHPPQLLL